MRVRIVFSDADGTLLNEKKRITPKTRAAIHDLAEIGISFVIASSRGPTGIYPIQEELGLPGPIICFSGGLILDEKRTVLWEQGFSKETAGCVLEAVEDWNREMRSSLSLAWCLYSFEDWFVKSRKDPRILHEERMVKARSREGDLSSVSGDRIHKIRCSGGPGGILGLERKLKEAFPHLSIVKSSPYLLEICAEGIHKGLALEKVCGIYGISAGDALAFGDNYNDREMLLTAGKAVLMANAPEDLRHEFPHHTLDNEHDGIAHALKELGLV